MERPTDEYATEASPRFVDAEHLTTVLNLLLEDAFEIENTPVEVRRTADRKLLLRAYGARYELTVVKKR